MHDCNKTIKPPLAPCRSPSDYSNTPQTRQFPIVVTLENAAYNWPGAFTLHRLKVRIFCHNLSLFRSMNTNAKEQYNGSIFPFFPNLTCITMDLAEILSVFDRNIEKWLLCNHWREVGYRNARRWRRQYRFFVCYRVWQRRTGLKTVASGGWITKTYTPKTVSVRASTICVADLSATTWNDTCIFTIQTFSSS